MIIDHITYHLNERALEGKGLVEFMELLGFEEIQPDDPFEHGYDVRWFKSTWRRTRPVPPIPKLHFVAMPHDGRMEPARLGLGHLCLVFKDKRRYNKAVKTDFCTRESGSGRAWLVYNTCRIEIRP